MGSVRMVHLRTVPSSFHARVVAARLGADGIPTQLRGSVDGPYPIGDVLIFVPEEDAATARDLLLADQVEAERVARDSDGSDGGSDGGSQCRPQWMTWVMVAAVLTLWAALSMRLL